MSETETPATTLSAGDVVILKSGGPMLTVASILGDLASCVWFSDQEEAYRFEDLPTAVLVAVEFDEEDEDEAPEDAAEEDAAA